MTATPRPWTPLYATVAPDDVAAFAHERWDLGGRPTCTFLNRGFNDVYAIRTGDGRDLILRLSSRRGREALVAAETAFLARLARAGAPVAAVLRALDGAWWQVAEGAEGPRPAALFAVAPGRVPELDDPSDARAQGVALARVHLAGDGPPPPAEASRRLDLDRLLREPVAAIVASRVVPAELGGRVRAFADRLAAFVADHGELTTLGCHGDCHGLNARIDADGVATLFDLDDGGVGPLAYDLAVHLWAQVSFGRRRLPMWHAFLDGYRATRPLAARDHAAVPAFVAVRHLWLLGEYARGQAMWGELVVSAALVERELAFLLAWEARHLERRLV